MLARGGPLRGLRLLLLLLIFAENCGEGVLLDGEFPCLALHLEAPLALLPSLPLLLAGCECLGMFVLTGELHFWRLVLLLLLLLVLEALLAGLIDLVVAGSLIPEI